MTLRLAEVVLLRMRFHEGPGSKVRPALVVLDTGDDDVIVAPITSKPRLSAHDLPITEWSAAGLNVPSTARVHKLTVISKLEIVKRIGTLSESDRQSLVDALCRAFCAPDSQ